MKNIKRAVNSTLAHILQLSTRAFTPRFINLDITWRCNINCIMCSARQKVNNFSEENLSPERFKYILTKLPKLRLIDFMGLGEPLMNPHFFELLDVAESRNIKASLITNGTLLDKDKIKRLNDNLVKVYVSIDSPDPEKFDRIRCGAKFSEVVENIRNLKKLKPHVHLSILVVLMKDIIEDLPELVKLAKDIPADCINVNHILALDERDDGRRVSADTSEARYYLEKAEDLAKEYKIEFISRPLQPKIRRCWQPWLAPLIMANGDIYPCCFMDRSVEPVCTEWYAGVPLRVPFCQYKLGNIFKDNFAKIWNGKDFRLLRKRIRDYKTKTNLTVEELNLRRQRANLDEKFSYCRICLFKWSAGC